MTEEIYAVEVVEIRFAPFSNRFRLYFTFPPLISNYFRAKYGAGVDFGKKKLPFSALVQKF